MTTINKSELERIVTKGGFHSKVASTVLLTNKMSYKQKEILEQVSEIYFDLYDFEIDVCNIKVDQKAEDAQAFGIKQQMSAL